MKAPLSSEHVTNHAGDCVPMCPACRDMTKAAPSSKTVLRFNYVKTSVGGSDGVTVTMGFDSLDMAQDVHKWLTSLQGSAVETSGYQTVIVGEYLEDGSLDLCKSKLPAGTKLYVRLPLHSPRSLAEDANTVRRQQPSKLHDAGSSPAGDAKKMHAVEALHAELQRVYGVASYWYDEAKRLRTALSAISTNTLKSSTNKHPQYSSGVAHGLGIAADMARTTLTQDSSQPARQSPQDSAPTIGAPTVPAAPGSPEEPADRIMPAGWASMTPDQIAGAVIPEKASERECSWGCYYVDGKLVRNPACTLHGASLSENGFGEL